MALLIVACAIATGATGCDGGGDSPFGDAYEGREGDIEAVAEAEGIPLYLPTHFPKDADYRFSGAVVVEPDVTGRGETVTVEYLGSGADRLVVANRASRDPAWQGSRSLGTMGLGLDVYEDEVVPRDSTGPTPEYWFIGLGEDHTVIAMFTGFIPSDGQVEEFFESMVVVDPATGVG